VALRDYLYLDTERLDDYLSDLDPGALQSVRETVREASEKRDVDAIPSFNETPAAGSRTEIEELRERTLSISAKHSFSRLYDALRGKNRITMKDVDEVLPVDTISKGDVVELTRDFTPSPVTEMIESMFELIKIMQGMGLESELAGSEDAIQGLSLLFQRDERDPDVPMLSESHAGDATVLFVAQRRFLLCPIDEFEGEMTIFGRAQRVVAPGDEVDMFDLLRVFPRSLRRVKGDGKSMRELLVELFEKWPDELGGPVTKDALTLKGPALFINPVAAYN
jgi:hypothetical protein